MTHQVGGGITVGIVYAAQRTLVTAYQHRYSTSFLRVLVVTTSKRRQTNLIAATETLTDQPAHYFWFTTLDTIKTKDVITSPIWLVATKLDEGLQRLVV